MRVAVVTPYYREPLEKLLRCHESVMRQTHPDVMHIMVADGYPREEVLSWHRCQHISLPTSHNDVGDAPRMIGCISAAAQGFNAIALLDADNWYEPDHLARMIEMHRHSGASIITCARTLRRPDTEEVLGICPDCDGTKFNDTNCYLLTDAAYPLLSAWGLRDNVTAQRVSQIGDRLFWSNVVRSGMPRAHSSTPTVNYETTFAAHYAAFAKPIPDFAKLVILLPDGKTTQLISYAEYQAAMARQTQPASTPAD